MGYRPSSFVLRLDRRGRFPRTEIAQGYGVVTVPVVVWVDVMLIVLVMVVTAVVGAMVVPVRVVVPVSVVVPVIGTLVVAPGVILVETSASSVLASCAKVPLGFSLTDSCRC